MKYVIAFFCALFILPVWLLPTLFIVVGSVLVFDFVEGLGDGWRQGK